MAGSADHVFRVYHWDYYQWMECPYWLWQEIQEFWRARGVHLKAKEAAKKAPEATNTADLITLAKQQGFDVDPAWEAEGFDSG